MTDTATIINDLLLAALDDCRIRIGPLGQRRLLERMVELAEIGGVEISVAHRQASGDNGPE